MQVEFLVDKTGEVRGWCSDSKQFGNFKPKENQEVIQLDVAQTFLDTSGDFTIQGGVLNITSKVEIDWQALWTSAKTTDAKFTLIAKKLGLI